MQVVAQGDHHPFPGELPGRFDDHLVIEFKKPADLGVSCYGGKPVHLLGETPGKAAVQPGQMFNMDTTIRAAALAFLKIEKHLATENM
jgi:hypothetical protein